MASASLPLLVKGDVDAFIAVFSNNLATMLTALGVVSAIFSPKLLYEQVTPAVGVAMLFGCLWYSAQALMKSKLTGRVDLCAQPFGINTPGVFAFCFSVMLPVYDLNYAKLGHDKAGELAWKVGVAGNLLQGVIEVCFSAIGDSISCVVPPVALLGSLASVGLTYLFTGSLQGEMFASITGIVPFYLVMLAMCANVRVPGLPGMLLPVLVGTILAWIQRQDGVVSAQEVSNNVGLLGIHLVRPAFSAFDSFGQVVPYLPVIFPVALTVSVMTIQCREIAAKAGDDYNLRWSMFGDGITTIVAALFGSPFGMTVFIGHPGFKAMGAHVGYNLLCGVAFAGITFTGLAGLFKAVFPPAALNPILLFIGLAICCDALDVTPPRHWPALMLSLCPCFCDWATTACVTFAAKVCTAGGTTKSSCQVDPNGSEAWTFDADLRGLFALGQGYMLTSILLTTMLVKAIDHEFRTAAYFALFSALCASIGLIHSKELFWPWAFPKSGNKLVVESHYDLHWNFTIAYLLLAGTFGLLFFAKEANKLDDPPHARAPQFTSRSGLLDNVADHVDHVKHSSTNEFVLNSSEISAA